MFLGKSLLMCILILNAVMSKEDYYEAISVELKLDDYDAADAYDAISQATKNIFMGVNGFEEKVNAELQRGTIMRLQYESNLDLEANVPDELRRNWTLLTRSGDYLLAEEDFKSLVTFHNENEEIALQSKTPCLNGTENCGINKQDFEDVLAKSRKVLELTHYWAARQNLFIEKEPRFGDCLSLVNKAYVPNGEHSSIAYWEMLTESENGYAKAKELWNDILPLYKKLHAFVKTRLYKYYNITSTSDLLPVYLLGSNFGNDWSNIADIVLPHPYLYTEINAELKHQTVQGIFELAANTTGTMGLGTLGRTFFTESIFNFSSCGPHIFTHCGSSKSEVLTCNRLSWVEYLNIYEASVDISLRSEAYEAYPRMQTRFSAVDEALKGLGSLLAMGDLAKNGILQDALPKDVDDEYNRKNAALLLLALRVLPRLPYYLIADTLRLEELKYSSGNFVEKWWKNRNGVQGIQGLTGLEPDFLGDPVITQNKPYLSKFFGIFLQFQIVDYYQKYFANEKDTLGQTMSLDETFRNLIHDRPNKSWLHLIHFHYGIDGVSSAAILDYFKPLQDYLDNAPNEQVVVKYNPRPRPTKTPAPVSVNSTDSHVFHNQSSMLMGKNNGTDDERIIKRNEETPDPATTSSSEAIGVFSAIAGLIVISVVILLIIRKLKRRQKWTVNNRKFEDC